MATSEMLARRVSTARPTSFVELMAFVEVAQRESVFPFPFEQLGAKQVVII